MIKFPKENGTDAYISMDKFETVAFVAIEKNVRPDDLLAISIQESAVNSDAVRDVPGELAIGAFQIRIDLPGRNEACAKDFLCAARWAADYLNGNGYDPDNYNARYHALHCYNGCPKNATNYFYPNTLMRYSARLSEYFEKS